MKRAVLVTGKDNKRIALGLEYISKALENAGYIVERTEIGNNFAQYRNLEGEKIYVGTRDDEFIGWLEEKEIVLYHSKVPSEEGFYIKSCAADLTVISAGDDIGALYGCLELAERITEENAIPKALTVFDEPEFKLRGPAIGLQKTKIEPPRKTYEYPITPERFPWFYDKPLWEKFLDMLLETRCNILYIWSGHPFSSLVKVAEYPEALEVSEEVFQMNKEIFGWLTNECDRRGIWVVLSFYNIHIPLPFAQHHGLDLLQSSINPLVKDYTEKTIAEFIKSYPRIGLKVCLGEALRGTQNKTDWFVKTIIPAVKEGIKQANLKEEPPIILRGHDCDPYAAMQEAMPIYSNLYTMWKYNGESLTTYFPRGGWQERHRSLNGLAPRHIINVHIMANLEPFRFNAPGFIQKSVQAGQNRLGANGLHLYPLFFWDWPYSPDKEENRLIQIERDWMWYGAWFRYVWNPNRDEHLEKTYWAKNLAKKQNVSFSAASILLDAMESMGQVAPKLLGRIGITEGNRQTMSLGMLMSQFTNSLRYRPNKELWLSVAEAGERLDEYVKNELEGKEHIGETPMDMIEEITYFAERASEKYKIALKEIDNPNAEILRIGTDIEAMRLLTKSYCAKIKGAAKILTYKYTMDERCMGDFSLLEEAEEYMQASLEEYRKLAALTEKTYLYANSMQTRQRKIPFPDGDAYGHWTQCLPEYEEELANFKVNLGNLKNGILPGDEDEEKDIPKLTGIDFELLSDDAEEYDVVKGTQIFTDCDWIIQSVAGEIDGLRGVRFGLGKAIEGGVKVKLKLLEDSKILIGYMGNGGVEWLKVPELETNTHADDRGGLAVVYANAVKAQGCPPINIHAFTYEKGTHELYFGTGGFMIAGVVSESEELKPRNADLAGEALDTLDWMYEKQ